MSSTRESRRGSAPGQIRRGDSGFVRINLALFAAGLATFIAMYCTQALLPVLADAFGTGPATTALAVSMTTGMLALSIIPASVLSERFGRTRVMLVSAAASAVIGLLLPLSPTMTVLLVGRGLQGLALAGVPAVAMAYLAEEVHAGSLGQAMGRYVAGTTIGGLAGRLLPSGVLELADWRWGMFVAAIAALVCTAVFAYLLPGSRNFTPQPVDVRTVLGNLGGHLRNPSLLALFGLAFLLMGGFVSAYNFLGYRLLDEPFSLSEGAVGLVFLMYLSGTFTAATAGRAADRFGRRRTLPAMVLVMAVGLVVTLPDSLACVLIGMLLFTGGFFGAHSVASGWVGVRAETHRAEASSLYLFAYYMGSSIAGALAGLAYGIGGWAATVAYIGVLTAGAAILAAALYVGAGDDRRGPQNRARRRDRSRHP